MKKCRFKTRLVVTFLIALLAVMTALSGCGGGGDSDDTGDSGSTAGEIELGFIWPETGGSSAIGIEHKIGAQKAIDEINANGGVKSMDGAKLVPVWKDSESTADVGATKVEELVTVDNVPIVIGCYNSVVTLPAAERANALQTPFLSMGAVGMGITNSGFEWVFRINNTAEYDVVELIKGLQLAEEEKNVEIKTYAVIYENTDWGADNAEYFKKYAEEEGWECVVDEPVTTPATDLSSQVAKIKAANPDVVNASFYTNDAILFADACFNNDYQPPYGFWSSGGGMQAQDFFTGVQDPGSYEYMFVQEDWGVAGPYLYDWIKELKSDLADEGITLNSYFAQGWTAAYVAYEALEAAGSTDKEAIRTALRELDIENSVENPSRVVLTGYPRIKFDAQGQNTYSTGTICQYQEGVAVGLSPISNRFPEAEFIIPIPDDFGARAGKMVAWGELGKWAI
jgi:branched-chain amino acid transport system substrate-binding protein